MSDESWTMIYGQNRVKASMTHKFILKNKEGEEIENKGKYKQLRFDCFGICGKGYTPRYRKIY